jgi:hypothetical protein
MTLAAPDNTPPRYALAALLNTSKPHDRAHLDGMRG